MNSCHSLSSIFSVTSLCFLISKTQRSQKFWQIPVPGGRWCCCDLGHSSAHEKLQPGPEQEVWEVQQNLQAGFCPRWYVVSTHSVQHLRLTGQGHLPCSLLQQLTPWMVHIQILITLTGPPRVSHTVSHIFSAIKCSKRSIGKSLFHTEELCFPFIFSVGVAFRAGSPASTLFLLWLVSPCRWKVRLKFWLSLHLQLALALHPSLCDLRSPRQELTLLLCSLQTYTFWTHRHKKSHF